MAEVKLHGTWPSPFSYRVIWALKLKGIPYEYVEEDLSNKSPLLLHYNPVHKKIPVLVHGGKPICESTIILEYIDETWPEKPLLPSDPFERATARFWIKFIEDKGPAVFMIFRAKSDEERENAKKPSLEMLRTVEEWGFRGGDGRERKFFGGDEIGMADLAFGWVAHWIGVIEEVVDVKFLDANEFPKVYAWTERFKDAAVIRDNLPDRNLMAAAFRRRFEFMAHSGLLGGGIRWKTRKKMRENVSDERGQQNGTLTVLLQDPFEVLGSDLLMAILGYVDSRSVALSLLVSRSWYGIASSDSLWSSKCVELWLGIAHIPRLAQTRGLPKMAAYSLSVMDGNRTRIMREDLCDHAWQFHFNKHGEVKGMSRKLLFTGEILIRIGKVATFSCAVISTPMGAKLQILMTEYGVAMNAAFPL